MNKRVYSSLTTITLAGCTLIASPPDILKTPESSPSVQQQSQTVAPTQVPSTKPSTGQIGTTPSPSASPEASPTFQASQSISPSPTPTPSSSASTSPAASPSTTQTPAPTPSQSPSPTPSPTTTPQLSPSPTPSPTPTPEPITLAIDTTTSKIAYFDYGLSTIQADFFTLKANANIDDFYLTYIPLKYESAKGQNSYIKGFTAGIYSNSIRLPQSTVTEIRLSNWDHMKITKGVSSNFTFSSMLGANSGVNPGDVLTFSVLGYKALTTSGNIISKTFAVPLVSPPITIVPLSIQRGSVDRSFLEFSTYDGRGGSLELKAYFATDFRLKSISFFVENSCPTCGTLSGQLKNFSVVDVSGTLGSVASFAIQESAQTITLSEDGKQGIAFKPGQMRTPGFTLDMSNITINSDDIPRVTARIRGYTVIVGTSEYYVELP